MATSKLIFQLVNQPNQSPLDIKFGDSTDTLDESGWRFCDWDLDSHGRLRTITKQEAMVQSALKCVFTERQPSGYGMDIYGMIGEKDVTVRRMSLFMDITMAMIAMKGILDAQALTQGLSSDDLLATVSQLSVIDDSTDPSTTRIKMSLVSNSGATTTIGVV